MKFRKKPIVIEATQWFKNGDHPEDGNEVFPEKNTPGLPSTFSPHYSGVFAGERFEGKVVRYFRRPDVPGDLLCEHCDERMAIHGWIDTLGFGHIVCPGDWVITGFQGERYPCKPDIFAVTYEPVERLPEKTGGSAMAEAREQLREQVQAIVKSYLCNLGNRTVICSICDRDLPIEGHASECVIGELEALLRVERPQDNKE